ncbi:MAG: class I SAM-dependent rRNA methyltransferase [Atopobiaceae bacterium]|jgi:23S rRNA (cytosine1962-C5)-methyltransferase
MKQQRPYPYVTISKKAARSLKAGHPWVFEGEVLATAPAPTDGQAAANGDIVDVFEQNGTWQGAGLLSQESKIRVRIISRNANDRFDEAFWRRRITWAWELRKTTMGARGLSGQEPDTNCCRVIFSEADALPGLIVDRYEDVLVAQVGTVGMERRKDMLFSLMLDVLTNDGQTIRAIYERSDAPARLHEGLELHKGWWHAAPVGAAAGAAAGAADKKDVHSSIVRVQENGILFDIDVENSQKTGFFLDQKYNRRAVRELARGKRVLDCFSHVGPFGLNAAKGGAAFVRCVDISQTACDLARQNARLNGLDLNEDGSLRMGFTCANVLEYLPALRGDKTLCKQEGGPFDLIVLDPPAFTKSRSTVDHALKGYREINQAALQLLPRGGYLATCSCSHFMTTELLSRAIAEAAHNANVQLKQIEQRQQAPDHPIVWNIPETHYLDFFTFQVV